MAIKNLSLCSIVFLVMMCLLGRSTCQIPAPTWCVAKPGAPAAALQGFLDYCCGRSDVNCKPINPGGACFQPNTLKDHTSWCLDLYYRNTKDCRANIGMIVYRDPSYGDCLYI